MTAQFPRKRLDGSFCVLIVLQIETDDTARLVGSVSSWLEEWAHRHSCQTRFDEEVRYEQEFAAVPTAIWSEDRLTIRVECLPAARWWKDLVATSLVSGLVGAFEEIKSVERMQSCS